MSDHHAFLYTAAPAVITAVPNILQLQSADVQHVILDSFGIDDARQLTEAAAVRPVVAAERSFVIITSTITTEAQNALLKLFEDPPPTAVFHVVVPSVQQLLPTLRSRFLQVDAAAPSTTESDTFAAFLEQNHAERLATLADRVKAKDAAWMQSVLTGAHGWLATAPADTNARPSIALVDQYLMRRGASKKMLLEELALALPVK